VRQPIEREGFFVIHIVSTAVLLLGLGGIISGCAVPIAGIALTDILTGASIITTATTGKGTTEIALDLVTGQDCRFIEGALREDRDFCEEEGSPATEEDFKGLAGLIEDDAPQTPLPGGRQDSVIMVAEIDPPESDPDISAPAPAKSVVAQTAILSAFQPVALASLNELPDKWVVLASVRHGSEAAGLAAIAPASGAPSLSELKSGDAPLPFLPDAEALDEDMADWAVERLPDAPSGVVEKSFTLPATAITPFPPAPAKPALHIFLPHPEKPVLQEASVKINSAPPAG
jgi:hypothetical protein